MADFINTIDVLGDDAVIDSIIDRSITEFKDNKVKKIAQGAFFDCTKLEIVELPELENLGSIAFVNCKSLKEVFFPKISETHYYYTSMGSFTGCTSLEKVDLPMVTLLSGCRIFANCTSLTNVNLPNLQSIHYGDYIFNGCSSLSRLRFPKLKEIKNSFLANASALVALVLEIEEPCSLGNINDLKNTPIANGTGYIYVPRALVDSYKAATNWNTYADQFRALEDYTVDGTITGELDETKI